MSVTALFLGHQDISRRLTGNVFSDEMWSLESLSAKEAAGGSVDGMCIPGAVAAKVKDVRRDFFFAECYPPYTYRVQSKAVYLSCLQTFHPCRKIGYRRILTMTMTSGSL